MKNFGRIYLDFVFYLLKSRNQFVCCSLVVHSGRATSSGVWVCACLYGFDRNGSKRVGSEKNLEWFAVDLHVIAYSMLDSDAKSSPHRLSMFLVWTMMMS